MFYRLDAYGSNRYCSVTYPWDYYSKQEQQCPACGRMVQTYKPNYWPPKFRLEGGKRYPDCLDYVTMFDEKCGMLLSKKALEAFQREGITGLITEPVTVIDHLKHNQSHSDSGMPEYYCVYIQGRISLDYQTMHYRKKNHCRSCGQYSWSRQKIGESALDVSTWDQSDLCKLTDYPNVFICTSKVIDVIRKYQLKGFSKSEETDIFLPLKSKKVC